MTTVIENERPIVVRNCRAVFIQLSEGGPLLAILCVPSGKEVLAWDYSEWFEILFSLT